MLTQCLDCRLEAGIFKGASPDSLLSMKSKNERNFEDRLCGDWCVWHWVVGRKPSMSSTTLLSSFEASRAAWGLPLWMIFDLGDHGNLAFV